MLIVLSHRGWDAGTHRAQQLVQRLSDRWRVLWVEPLRTCEGAQGMEVCARSPTVDVLRAHVPAEPALDAHDRDTVLHAHIRTYLQREGVEPVAAWVTTHEAFPLAQALNVQCLVYDGCTPCGDNAEAARREARAVHRADLVFSDGAAQVRGRLAHCGKPAHRIDSGVDLHHFNAFSRDLPSWASMEAQALQGHLTGPRLGYAGAIDARLDTRLIVRLADARAEWQVVMVGPLLGLEASDLPQRPNISWLGAQPHELLPALMAGWSIGWLPWQSNAATVEASPVQALEYLACGLPVVAPWMPSLQPWAPAGVRLARNHTMHLTFCEFILAQPEAHRAAEQRVARRLLAKRSWDESARRAHALMQAHAEC